MFYKMIENKCKEWYNSENCTVRNLIEYIEKTVTYRQLFTNKLQYQTILSYYRTYGLLDNDKK